MYRTMLRALFVGSIAVFLMFGSGTDLAFADDEKAEEERAKEPQGIQFVKGWEAGKAQAKKDGRLIFLYFGRYTPQ